MVGLVALLVVGPRRLPGMMRAVGETIGKFRRMTNEVRAQTGIDQILREEGFEGGIGELRSLLRGDLQALRDLGRQMEHPYDPYRPAAEVDLGREYPLEGPDAAGALPDDLFDEPEEPRAAEPGCPPVPQAEPVGSEPPP